MTDTISRTAQRYVLHSHELDAGQKMYQGRRIEKPERFELHVTWVGRATPNEFTHPCYLIRAGKKNGRFTYSITQNATLATKFPSSTAVASAASTRGGTGWTAVARVKAPSRRVVHECPTHPGFDLDWCPCRDWDSWA